MVSDNFLIDNELWYDAFNHGYAVEWSVANEA